MGDDSAGGRTSLEYNGRVWYGLMAIKMSPTYVCKPGECSVRNTGHRASGGVESVVMSTSSTDSSCVLHQYRGCSSPVSLRCTGLKRWVAGLQVHTHVDLVPIVPLFKV